jgi:hypothetical protein
MVKNRVVQGQKSKKQILQNNRKPFVTVNILLNNADQLLDY